MIKQENIIINGVAFIKTYSDTNHYIKQVETGIRYSEAIDIVPSKYTYEETDLMLGSEIIEADEDIDEELSIEEE